MKAFAKLPNNFLIIGVSAFLTLAACAPVAQDAAHSNSPAETSTFADALTPPGGVPCRFTRPKYTALQRQLGIHGSVHVTYVVSTVGRIDLAIVDKSSGNQELDHAARDAILQGTCAPYVVDGVAHRAHPAQPALPASPLNRDAAASGAQPAATAAANAAPPAPSSKAPLSLAQAVQEAILQRQGIAPDSTKAALIKRWGQRMHDDPDIGRLLGNGPNHASVFALSPAMRAEFFSEAVLRLSPEERSKLIELTSKALDNAPPDCGGVKDAALVTSRYLPLGSMSDAEVDSYFGVTFAMFKLSAQQTPVAHVTEEQRAEASRAVANTLQNMLKNDPDGIRNVAAAVADPTGVSAEVWCTNARLYNRALLATPQPYRDWSIVASDIDGAAKLKALGGLQMPATGQATAASQEYATRVQRLVRPNIVWEGPIINAETAITVRCLPNGTLASATITRSSGNAAWDMAALRAVQRSDPMPTDATGRAPSEFVVVLRPAG
jgi:TonB family protein